MSKFISTSNLRKLADALQARYKELVVDEKERAMEAENNLQAKVDITQNMLGGKSIVYMTQNEFDSLTEAEKNDNSKTYFITDAVDLSHEHENKDFLDNLEARNITIGNSTKVFDGARDISYSLDEIGVASKEHNHDDVYYTETEIDGIIENVNDSLNTAIVNSKNDAINASKSYTDTAITKLVDSAPEAMNTLNELANAIKDHQDEYEAYISTVAANIATAKSEAIAEAAKKDTALHTTISAEIDADVADEKERAMEVESALQAEVELTKNMLDGRSIKYVTQAEYDALSEAEKNDVTKAYFVTGVADTSHTHENKDFLDNLAARNITIGNSTKVFDGANNLSYSLNEIGAASKEHNHDDKYYTETEIDGKIEDINETINTNLSSLQSNIATAKSEAIAEAAKKDTALHTTISAEIDADVADEKERAMEVESALQAEVELTKNMLDGRSIKYVTQAEYDALSEAEKNDVTKAYFVTGVADTSHTHENKDFLDNLAARNITIGNSTKVFDGANNLSYSLNEIGAASKEHNHDDKYYTETEIDGKIEDINDNIDEKVAALNTSINTAKYGAISESKSYTDTAITKLVDSAPEAMNTLNELATAITDHQDVYDAYVAEISGKLAGKSDTSHTHDDRYYTESEINSKISDINDNIDGKVATLNSAINGKAPVNHSHEYIHMNDCSNKDLNTIKTAGYYYGYTGMTNAPVQAIAVLEVIVYSPDWIVQRFTTVSQSSVTLERCFTMGSVWTDWKTCYDSLNKPSCSDIGAATSGHTHDDRYYTESEIDGKVSNLQAEIDNDVKVEKERAMEAENVLQTAINTKAPIIHYHNDIYYTKAEIDEGLTELYYTKAEIDEGLPELYYNKTEIDGKVTSINTSINGKSDTGHTHDDRYYTESEINTKISDINDNIDGKVATLNTAINGKADSGHTHDDRYFTETEVTNKLAGKSDTGHTHDDRYYTETEIDGKITTLNNAINSKSDSGHTHDDRYYTETEINTKLADINETINNKEATLQAGIQNLTNNKADISYVNGKLSVVDAIKLNGYSLWVGTSSELDAITTKDPNTLYFEIDDGTGEEVVQVNVTNGVLQLTTDKYQKTNMLDGTTIVFPAVNRFTEIHLYFNAGINMNLNFPDCKWRVDPNIEEGNSYELIATYNTMDWLVNLIVYS